jgi:hypothetical protein
MYAFAQIRQEILHFRFYVDIENAQRAVRRGESKAVR